MMRKMTKKKRMMIQIQTMKTKMMKRLWKKQQSSQ